MGTLEKIMQMQTKGISDADISQSLKKEGYSPQEINDGLNQAKIKSAVSQGEHPGEPPIEHPNQLQQNTSMIQNPESQQLPPAPQNPEAVQNLQTPQAPQLQQQTNNPVAEEMQESIMKPQDIKPSPEEVQNYNQLEDTMHNARQPFEQEPEQTPQYEEQFYPQTPAYPEQSYPQQQQIDTCKRKKAGLGSARKRRRTQATPGLPMRYS